jgi:endonuclease/exonuclease/phosphatase family metal-dependent hydrolase
VGEGWSERNLEIMQTLGSSLVALNQPFVIMGDFNMSPSEFAQGEFLNHVNAAVVSPDTDTFKQGNNSTCIDFFVVSSPLLCAVEALPVVNYDGRGPHHSVHLVFNGKGRDQVVNVPVTPTPFAHNPPCGPLRPFFFRLD